MNITERYIVDLDQNRQLLATAGVTYGRQFRHRGFYMNVGGCETQEQADEMVIKEIELKGWKLREKWWQFWRPRDFRLCRE